MRGAILYTTDFILETRPSIRKNILIEAGNRSRFETPGKEIEARCHSLFYPPYKVSPRVTEGWLNDTEMLLEASKMHPTAG